MACMRWRVLIHLVLTMGLLLPSATAAVQPPPPETRSPSALYLPLVYGPKPIVASAIGPDPFLSPLPTPEVPPFPTPAPTPEPSPEPLPSPSGDLLLPYLNLEAAAHPQAVPPGETVTLRWRLEHRGEQALEGALLIVTLPASSEAIPPGAPSPWRYDPARRALTWAMGRLEPHTVLEAQAEIRLVGVRVGDAVTVPAELRLADGTRVAQAEVSVGVLPPAPEVSRLGSDPFHLRRRQRLWGLHGTSHPGAAQGGLAGRPSGDGLRRQLGARSGVWLRRLGQPRQRDRP